ncbi:MAG: hypothetical protein JWQ27_54 [Ferruginibacter sp.]|nr:hypothetical protein [Ferruginibacter sp.]
MTGKSVFANSADRQERMQTTACARFPLKQPNKVGKRLYIVALTKSFMYAID